MKATITKVTRSAVIAVTEKDTPYGWLKRNHACLEGARAGDVVEFDGCSLDPIQVEKKVE